MSSTPNSNGGMEERVKRGLEEMPPDLRSKLDLIRDASSPKKVSFWAGLFVIGWFIVWLIRHS